MPIYGQVGLFSLAAFAFGVLFTWLALARPLRRRVSELEDEVARQERAASTAATRFYDAPGHSAAGNATPSYATAVPGVQPAAPAAAYAGDEQPAFPSFFDGPEHLPLRPTDERWADEQWTGEQWTDEPAGNPAAQDVGAGVDTGDTDRSEQDAAYLAHLEEVRAENDPGEQEATESVAEERGALRLSGEDSGSGGLADDRPTEVFRPITADFGATDLDAAGGSADAFRPAEEGEVVSGQLNEAHPLPEAPVDSREAGSEQARRRALFEPALQPQGAPSGAADEQVEPAAPAPAAAAPAEHGPVPTGPFGPGSALPRPDGSAPSPEFVVKARTSSMVFHTTSSPFYDRLLPQVWFRSPDEAMRAGFTSWERPESSWGAR